MKKVVRLTEGDFRNLVGNSVRKVLREYEDIYSNPMNKPAKKLPYADEWGGTENDDEDNFDDPESDFLIGMYENRRHRKPRINEAESGGWVVETGEAQQAYELAVQEMGEEYVNEAIVRCLGTQTLSQCLAYLFRQWNFREWENYRATIN